MLRTLDSSIPLEASSLRALRISSPAAGDDEEPHPFGVLRRGSGGRRVVPSSGADRGCVGHRGRGHGAADDSIGI